MESSPLASALQNLQNVAYLRLSEIHYLLASVFLHTTNRLHML